MEENALLSHELERLNSLSEVLKKSRYYNYLIKRISC